MLTKLFHSPLVAVVDDDELDREQLMDDLRAVDLEPYALTERYGPDIDRMMADIEALNTPFVICDHKLQPKRMATFAGAEVVKRLIKQRRPAMLLTMYQSTNRLELRSIRHELPVVVGRHEFDPASLDLYRSIVERDIANDPVDERKAHRVIIRVEDVVRENEGTRIIAFVPSWSPDQAVIIPDDCVDTSMLPNVESGMYLLGDVNIGASGEDDLFFVNVNEIIPPAEVGL